MFREFGLTINKLFGSWLSYAGVETRSNGIPRISLTVETSGATMSKSGDTPFSITLKATVDSAQMVTISTFQTVLWPHAPALEEEGLTFTNVDTGQVAERNKLCILYKLPDYVTKDTDFVVEIPAQSTGSKPYAVQHSFRASRVRQPAPGGLALSMEDKIDRAISQTAGFEIGLTYEVGIGTTMTSVPWWHFGNKRQVFSGKHKHRHLRPAAEKPKMEMVLVKTARFTVIE